MYYVSFVEPSFYAEPSSEVVDGMETVGEVRRYYEGEDLRVREGIRDLADTSNWCSGLVVYADKQGDDLVCEFAFKSKIGRSNFMESVRKDFAFRPKEVKYFSR